jgi:hypothetical protein
MASQSHRICVADSPFSRHLSQVGLFVNPTSSRCPFRWRCPVSSLVTQLLGYKAGYSLESQPTFRRNISPPSSGSKNKSSKKPASSRQQSELILRLWRRRWNVPGSSLVEVDVSKDRSRKYLYLLFNFFKFEPEDEWLSARSRRLTQYVST